ncbi:hypothetical protein FSS13T_22800 [Flavobacterium saliperosum S13]|uniref:Uncharacterized protein n=2 Tax=Flavobacterium saliperosum TaxID=329186 RepID=A0A1G4VNW2_9FLAO|nr:hypothetical protein [Flavobacterium saliperosum]ESU23552.1 hypothetical protein FSS13T_22800 [Flavobacterium saliperosum S13]SCX09616.1 hypothetical protein SAMN02927925_01416 [Flavobacterium saliperosum]
MGKKILVLGVAQNNFLSFLYGALKTVYPDFTITVPSYREVKEHVAVSDWMYDNTGLKKKTTPFYYCKAAIVLMFSKHHYGAFFFMLFFEKKVSKALHFLIESVKEKAFFLQNDNFANIDTFHFHYMQYSYLRELFLVPEGKKIVCSFWGSDLMRTSDTFNHYFVKKALHRADVITCQSTEMREIILSKFGRTLYDKIQINNFPIDESVFNGIDTFLISDESVVNFKKDYGFSSTKLNVAIGHNGNPQNNHLKCIAALRSFPHKEKLHLIVNLCYALPQDQYDSYKEQLHTAFKETGIDYVIIEKFFTGDELVFSRLATDVFIHVPVSDALSATLTEMMYAGSIAITGGWLPYNTLRQLGLYYHDINEFDQLSGKLEGIVAHFEDEKAQCKINASLIRDYFFRKQIVEKWAKILS